MASRLINKGRRHLLDRIDAPICSTSCLSTLGRPLSSKDRYTGYISEASNYSVGREHWGCTAAQILKQPSVSLGTRNSISVNFDISLPFGAKYFLQSVRTATTATAGQPRGEEKNDDQSQKQPKEPSPEECDLAVEGLNTTKAKAKAKQLQESQKDAKRPLQRLWAVILGIGPALRAIASMSRCKSLLLTI